MSMGSPSQGGDTPPPEEEFIPPGGITPPEHFEYRYAAHLINNILNGVAGVLDIADEKTRNEVSRETQTRMTAAIKHLLTKYAADLESPQFSDWKFFLKTLGLLARDEQWQEIYDLYAENRNSLPGLRALR